MKSGNTIAVTASKTGGTLSVIQRSCRPFMENFSTCSVSQFHDSCSLGVDEVGLTTTRNTKSFPLVMPPTIPPAWFVPVFPDASIICLLYTSDAADERSSVDLGGRRIIEKKKS